MEKGEDVLEAERKFREGAEALVSAYLAAYNIRNTRGHPMNEFYFLVAAGIILREAQEKAKILAEKRGREIDFVGFYTGVLS
jgi:hypothetical protein